MEAIASAQLLEWQASMERGLASMSKHYVYELVPAPKGCKIVGSEVGISIAKAILMTKFAVKDLGDVSLECRCP